MKVTLGSNIASMLAQRRLKESGSSLSKVFERLSSGMRINRAADDPAALERLRATADAYLETPAEWGKAPTREIDEMELNQLRALGYASP